MKKNINSIKKLILIIAFGLLTSVLMADPPNPNGGNGNGGGALPGGGAPIGSGVALFIGLAVSYGVKKKVFASSDQQID